MDHRSVDGLDPEEEWGRLKSGCMPIMIVGGAIVGVLVILMGLLALLSAIRNGEPLGIGDPAPKSHQVAVRNTADTPILLWDDAEYASRVRGVRFEPGQTMDLEIGYLPFYGVSGPQALKNKLCVGAKTLDGQVVYYKCPTLGELEAAGWKVDIVKRDKEKP